MKNMEVKFVIVGSGNIANTYVSAIANIENAEVVGIVSRSLKKPSILNTGPSIPIAESLSKLSIDFDAVIICTPNGLHHNIAIEAALLGKHVLTEKPLDITIKAMDKMILACEKANVKLGVAYQRRMSGDNQLVKNLIHEKKLGRIFAVDLAVKNYRDDNYYMSSKYRGTWLIDGGGPFIQQASHYIDLYGWYFGKPEKVISRLKTYVHNIEVEDHGVALCLHRDGMIGTITASTAAKPGFPAKLEIHSDKGTVIMENDNIIFWSIDGMENPSKQTKFNQHVGAATHLVNDTTNHEMIIKDFIQSIIEDRKPFVDGESGRIATEIILEIYKSNVA